MIFIHASHVRISQAGLAVAVFGRDEDGSGMELRQADVDGILLINLKAMDLRFMGGTMPLKGRLNSFEGVLSLRCL
jgi:hypothetical protein